VGLLAFGLHGAELGGVLFDGAADARLIEGEELELARLLGPGFAFGKGGVDLRVAGCEVIGELIVALGRDGVFDGADALEAPFILGDLLGKLLLEDARGGECVAVAAAVGCESGRVLWAGDVDLACYPGFEGI
jgi:hypothetical protein